VAYWVLKGILSPIFFVLWKIKVEGRENIPKKGPAVLAANHQSFCDSFFIPLVVTRRVTFLAKAEYFDAKKTAWFFRAAGQIPIHRGGGSASERALETARADVLRKDRILCLYPEGTRTVDAYVHKGRTGVTRLSRECGVPIIPVGVVGTVDVQPVNSNFMRPFKRVTIRFGKPMEMAPPANPDDPLEGHDQTECRAFTDALMHEIARLSEREYVDEYVPSRTATTS
jgi:1-acyl-sn-glycerol-3-phosphate acyltransferase